MSVSDVKVDRPPTLAKPWTHTRTIGFILVGLWLLAFLTLAWWMIAGFNHDLFDKYYDKYVSGLMVTLKLVFASITLGALLSFPIAWMRMSKNRILNAISYAYVYFFRGTPLLVQTFMIYYGLGEFRTALEAVYLWDFFKDAWNCGVFAFTLNTAALSGGNPARCH